MGAPLIHIGLPRAASTTLQRQVFPLIPQVLFLGSDRGSRLKRRFFPIVGRGTDEEFQQTRLDARDLIRSAIDRDARDVVVSYEGWCRPSQNASVQKVAQRLADCFLGAKVLIVTREPRAWLVSCYQKSVMLQTGGKWPVDRPFCDLSSIGNYYNLVRARPDLFFGDVGWRVSELVHVYQKAFGDDRVIVTPYEWLMRDKLAGLHQLFPEWDVPATVGSENTAVSGSALKAAQVWHKLPKVARRVTRSAVQTLANHNGSRARTNIPEWIEKDLAERLVQEKAILQRYVVGPDLVSLGY